MHNFKELNIWKNGIELVMGYYKLTSAFPKEEQYNLTSQMRRAAVSVPSNIAEGTSRKSNKDLNRFLQMSLGSSFELETQLIIAQKLDYISETNSQKTENKTIELQKMIYGFSKTLNVNL